MSLTKVNESPKRTDREPARCGSVYEEQDRNVPTGERSERGSKWTRDFMENHREADTCTR